MRRSRIKERAERAEWHLGQLSEANQRERRERYRELKLLGASGEDAWRESVSFTRYRALKRKLLFLPINKPRA